jgi:AcrR family transcriptional regulator
MAKGTARAAARQHQPSVWQPSDLIVAGVCGLLTAFQVRSYDAIMGVEGSSDRRLARKERILDAAAQLLLRVGYGRVTIEDVAQAAEVGKGTVYLHWRAREDLFAAVLDRELARALEEVAEGVTDEPGSWQLHRLIRAAYVAIMNRPLLKAMFQSDPEVLGRFARRRSAERIQSRAKALDRYLQWLSEIGQVRQDLSLEDLSVAVLAVWLGFVLLEPQVMAAAQEAPRVPDMERRADLLAATMHSAFGTSHPVSAAEDAAMRAQVTAWLRRMTVADAAEDGAAAAVSGPAPTNDR